MIRLASLKTRVDNLDVDKPKTIPADLRKLDNDVKETVYDKLVSKVNAIDTKIPCTSKLATKTQYDLYKQGLEKNVGNVG